MKLFKALRERMSYVRVIALGFVLIVLVGAVLLSLPISSAKGEYTSFVDALFTSTSATCVTGLVVRDTSEYWSGFGKGVIIVLIQIGGIGFMSVVTLLSMIMGRTIHLRERKLLMQSAGGLQVGGIVSLLKKIVIGTVFFELLGAIFLSFRFCPQFGFLKGIIYAVFHSVSAFCNAGFDLMPGEFTSMTAYVNDPLINIVLMFLILIGGLGYVVWNDIWNKGFKFSKYCLHTKIVLVLTAILTIGGTALFYIFEYNNLFTDMNIGEKLIASAFAAISPRTAGFNTIDLAGLSGASSLMTLILMLIGGNPGSTAGGIKTTTFAVLIMTVIASVRRNKNVEIFKKRLDDGVARQAYAVVTIYLSAVFISTLIICGMENFGLIEVLFETVSAAATVGATMGITTKLNVISKLIIIFLMYGGRVGGLTLGMVLAEKKNNVPVERPRENILIG